MSYQLYVAELSKRVSTENTKFRAANPQFNGMLECLYAGMTSKTPQERFRQHKEGYVNKIGHKLSANIVQKWGHYLRPSLYEHTNQKAMIRGLKDGRKAGPGVKKERLCRLPQLRFRILSRANQKPSFVKSKSK